MVAVSGPAYSGDQSDQESSGSSVFPVRTRNAIEEPLGVSELHDSAPHDDVYPASYVREVTVPRSAAPGLILTTWPRLLAAATTPCSAPGSGSSALTCCDSTSTKSVTSPVSSSSRTRPSLPVPTSTAWSLHGASDRGTISRDSQSFLA